MIDINKYSIDATKFKILQPENKIEWRIGSAVDVNSWVMRITADRRIEVNEDVEVTEAARKVLDAMQHLLTPQRTWVDLTDEEIDNINYTSAHMLAREVEAKLKEKNT